MAAPCLSTAEDVLAKQHPLLAQMIKKLSQKWEKRTRNMSTKWPEGGTFDLETCRDMQVLIKNYKLNQKGPIRAQKRKEEENILGLFRKKGEMLRTATREHEKDSLEEAKVTAAPSPPYVQELPVYKKLSIEGDNNLEGDDIPLTELRGGEAYPDLSKLDIKGGLSGFRTPIREMLKNVEREERMARGEENEEDEEEVTFEDSIDRDYEKGELSPAESRVVRLKKSTAAAEKESTEKHATAQASDPPYVCNRRVNEEGSSIQGVEKGGKSEDQVQGIMLAVGDVKALLTRVLELEERQEVLKDTLQRRYPTQITHETLLWSPLKDDESPVSYVRTKCREWRQEFGVNPEDNPLLQEKFRESVLKGLPTPVKKKLKKVVTLYSMTFHEFCDHVAHAVCRHRESQREQEEKDKEALRKLTQQQLTAGKKKLEGGVGASRLSSKESQERASFQEALQVLIDKQKQIWGQLSAPWGYQAMASWPEAENNFGPRPLPRPQYMGRGRGGPSGLQRGRGQRGGRGLPTVPPQSLPYYPRRCWGCGRENHLRNACPTNPWQDNRLPRGQRPSPRGSVVI